MADTIAMADNSTRPMGTKESNRLRLRENNIFEGGKDIYEIQADKLIGSGGESQIYLAKRKSNGELVVAKIYDEFADTVSSRNNRKKIIKFLNENSDYKKTHIMPLLDYGDIPMESDDGEDFSKPIDIIPYCKDGELTQCDYITLKNKVIPEILYAINLLHTSGLVHRDIKPNNIYMLNNEVVIADFGTSGEISSSDKFDYIGTQKKRGTVGYTAPEVWQGYAVIASDYYSFGCTIATLYKGEHVYKNLFNKNDDTKLKKAMNTNGLPLHCTDTETDLQILVDALVLTNETERAGYEDVMRWISNSQSFASNWKHKRQYEDETHPLGFNFKDKIYNDETELTNAMLAQWEDAKRYLYRDNIAPFFKQKNPALADKTISIVERKETAHNHDLGLAMFLHFFNTVDKPKCPIYWYGKKYESLSDISAAILANKSDENNIIAMLRDKFLSWKFKNSQEKPNQDSIATIEEIENITVKYPQLGYYTFMYKFAPIADKENSTPDKIFKEITYKRNDWHKTAKESVNDDMMLANLIDLGYKNNVLRFKEGYTGEFISEDSISDLELFYLLFEEICEDKTFIREHYLQYSPQAYLYWLQQNLNLYSFNSPQAKEIEKKIKNIKIDKKMNISKIWESLKSLRVILLNDFMKLFQNNYLLTYMGLRTKEDKIGITTQNPNAFFVGNFFGINVPVGYLKTIGCQTGSI